MEFYSVVSPPSKKLIPTPADPDLTPRPLRINKRKRQVSRHIYTTHANLPTGSLVPAVKVRRAATMSYPPTFMRHQSTWHQDKVPDSIRSSRAVTLGTTCGGDNVHQAAPCYGSSDNRDLSRFSSNAEPRRTLDLNGSPDSDSESTVRRKTPFKRRILSRVMNTLIGKPSGSQPITEENGTRRLSAEESTSDQYSRPISDPRSSFSSTARSSSIGTNLETALSEFPEPPVSTLTSPTTISTFEHAPPSIQAYRKLYAPGDIAVLRPEVSITPEFDGVNSNRDQSLHVAVETSAVVGTTRKSQDDGFHGLDVAVIIDNSLFASPATLMGSCETARFLSSLLDPSNDRMAIICTSSFSVEDPDLRTLMPLTCVNARKIKATVDAIVSSTERPSPLALDGALRSAKALLEQSTPRDQNSGLGPSAFGHIFVLTPHSSGLPPELLVHDKIQFHLVGAGSVPWKGEAKVRCNGWKLQSMHSRQLQYMRHIKDEDTSSLFNRLRTAMVDARTGSLHGGVSDLVLDIKPGRHCTIEGVIGHRTVPSIQRGERVVALIKLKVGLLPSVGYTLTSHRQQDRSTPACIDPNVELDELLGTTPVTILSAKLKYKHSLLPDTQCISAMDYRLKRPLRSVEQTDAHPRASAISQNHHQIQVQKDFAFHIATHHEPRQAMMVLIEDFGDGGRRSVCPDYLKLLIEELKYQARTIERFDLADYRSGPVAMTPRELRPDIWGQEHFGQGLFDASNYKPQEWITNALDEVAIQFPISPSPKPKFRSCLQSDETMDDARKIWVDLKMKRQLGRSGSENRKSASNELDEATRRLKTLALRNKRSVGTETLKSLAYPHHRGRAVDSYAPWL
ncbi:MAG: hypothetical protein Q9166_003502 [cf. Caloplaca sp. 2 TL-2023]